MNYELVDPNDKREFTLGDIVKMNPFCIDDADSHYGSNRFEGEREITRMGSVHDVLVQGSNWWLKKHLLIKGVDYE